MFEMLLRRQTFNKGVKMEKETIEKRIYNKIEAKQLFGLRHNQRIGYISKGCDGSIKIEIHNIEE